MPCIIAWVQEVSETLLHSRLLLIYRPLTLVHPFEMNCFKLSSIPQACNQTIIALYFPLLPSSPHLCWNCYDKTKHRKIILSRNTLKPKYKQTKLFNLRVACTISEMRFAEPAAIQH